MAHLGARISALVDGQLSPSAAERALEHVARCTHCHRELRAERRAHELMNTTGQVEAPGGLTARLLSLAPQADVVPAPSFTSAMSPIADAVPQVPAPRLVSDRSSGERRAARRGWFMLATGVVVALSAGFGAVLALGSCPVVSADRQAEVAFADLARATLTAETVTSSGVSVDVGQWAITTADLTSSLGAIDVREEFSADDMHELVASTDDGSLAIVQQVGQLDTSALAGIEPIGYQGAELRIISTAPFHAIWQYHDTVVTMVSDLPTTHVAAILQTLRIFDSGLVLTDRLGRGLDEIGQAVGLAG